MEMLARQIAPFSDAIFHQQSRPPCPLKCVGERMARVFRRATPLGLRRRKSLIIERYSAEGRHERYADLARQIVTRKPDVIVTGTDPVVIAFMAALPPF
jgi:putative ABC transport system substrate-binding protein